MPNSHPSPTRKHFTAIFALSFTLLAASASADTPPSTDATDISYPTFGLSFTPPPGWVADPCPPLPDIVRLLQYAPNTHQLVAQISIDSRDTPPFQRDKLNEFALNSGASVLSQGFEIDRAPAVAVRKDHHDDKSGPFLLLVANHDKRSYGFTIITNTDQPSTHDLITLCKSVHWISVENPIDHIQPDHPMPLFDNKATIQLPLLFRSGPAPEHKNLAYFVLPNAASKPVATITLAFIPAGGDNPGIPTDEQLSTIRNTMLENAQKQWHMSDYPLLEMKTPVPHGISTTLTKITSLTSEAQVATTYNRYCAIFAPQGVTYIEFESYAANDEDVQKWDQALLAIANSLTFTPSPATQP